MPTNQSSPLIMYIDHNSCFATLEQQANPLIRNKPVVVAAYNKPFGAILSPSIEAKRLGIKMGMRVSDAQLIYPNVIVRAPDPPKYREAHQRFMKIFRSYSPDVTPKSIDEAVIDFHCFLVSSAQPLINNSTDEFSNKESSSKESFISPLNLLSIAKEIKQRIRTEIGEYVSCSIGIAPSRWWGKLGAGLHKPDGLDIITHENIKEVLASVTLMDLCGINVRYQLRLNRYGIYTPSQFLEAPLVKLQNQVFKSVTGYYWYMRLRGWEVDSTEFDRKSYGQQYHLTHSTKDEKELLGLLMKLCEKMGRRLREANSLAKGIHVGCYYRDHTFWHHGQTFEDTLYTTYDLFQKAKAIFKNQPERKIVTKLSVTCFNLQQVSFFQNELFDEKKEKRLKVSETLDKINDRYGEYIIHPATMMKMKDKVIDRIAFGKSGI